MIIFWSLNFWNKLHMISLFLTKWITRCHLLSFQYYVTSFVFYQKQNVGTFHIILGVIMTAVTFESKP